MDDAALEAVRRAITDAGSHPGYHRSVMRRHRAEWPSLWHALDKLLADRPGTNAKLPPVGYLLVDGRGRDVIETPASPDLL